MQTVLSGDVYTSLSLLVDMKDVSLELLDNPKSTGHNRSLARYIICSNCFISLHFFFIDKKYNYSFFFSH